MRCVGGTNKKYANLAFLMACASKINLIQIEVVALEEVGFLLLEKPKCPLVNQVGA